MNVQHFLNVPGQMSSQQPFDADAFLSKLDVDENKFDRNAFLAELAKTASKEELREFIDRLRRSCVLLQTERISFINDKYPEVIDSIQSLKNVEEQCVEVKTELETASQKTEAMGYDFEALKMAK